MTTKPNLIVLKLVPYGPKKYKNYKDKYPNFEKGVIFQHATKTTINPLIPPVVNLTQTSAITDGAYVVAMLRDRKIFDTVRLYLSFLYDKPLTKCVNGMTKSHCKILLLQKDYQLKLPNLNIFTKSFRLVLFYVKKKSTLIYHPIDHF
jgi:hypothetical protein